MFSLAPFALESIPSKPNTWLVKTWNEEAVTKEDIIGSESRMAKIPKRREPIMN